MARSYMPEHIQRMLDEIPKADYFPVEQSSVHVLYGGDSVGYFEHGKFSSIEYDERSKRGMPRKKLAAVFELQERIKAALSSGAQRSIETYTDDTTAAR